MAHRNRTARRLLASASLAAVAAALAGAASAQQASAPPPNVVRGVTVTAPEVVETAPVAPPLTATYTESTITAEQVRELSPSASTSIQTMLNDQPSVYAYTNGPLGVQTDVNFRAFNSGQFEETYDGIALNDLFNSAVTGQGLADNQNNVLLLPQNIDSVEVYRGINNPSVNSYNSLGGTVDFLPRLPEHTTGVDIGASYGSFQTVLAHATVNSGDIGGFRQMLSYNYGNSEGWAQHTGDRNNNLYYSSAYDAANGDTLHVFVIANRNDGHTPFQMPVGLLQQYGGFYQWPSNVAYENDHDTNLLGIIDFRAALSPDVTFDNKFFTGANNYLRTSYANPAYSSSPTQPYVLPNQAEDYDYWIYNPNGPFYNPVSVFGSKEAGTAYHFYGYQTWGAGYQPSVQATLPFNTITLGGNVMFGQLHSREYWYGSYNMPMTPDYNDAWDEHDERVFASVYVQDEIDLFDKRLSITPGIKYVYAYTTDTDSVGFFYPYGGTDGNSTSFISPTIGVNYKFTDNVAAYAAFGQNVKFPDITAYYNGIPGTTASTPPPIPPVTVKPEHVNDYELGVRYQQQGLSASLSYYREDFTNTFIDSFNPATYLTVVSNGGSSRYQGVELHVRGDFGDQTWGHVLAEASAAYNDAEFTSYFNSDFVGGSNSNADVPVVPGEKLADVPDVLVYGDASWSYQGWRVGGDVRYVGDQYTDNIATGVTKNPGGDSTTKIAPFTLVDLAASKTIKFAGWMGRPTTLLLQINVDNVFNEYYFNTAYTQQSNYLPGSVSYLVASPAAPRSFMGTIDLKF